MQPQKTTIVCLIVLISAFALCMWPFRWDTLPDMFLLDTAAESGFVNGTSWYSYSADGRDTQYNIDTCEVGSDVFEGMVSILDEISCRKSLFSKRNLHTLVGEPSVSITYCRGERCIWLTFNGRYLDVSKSEGRVGKLYKVKPESGRILSDYITKNGYHLQTYLQETKMASTPAQTYLHTHTSEEILAHFSKATYFVGGFSDVQDLVPYQQLRFAILASEHGGAEWYDSTAGQYAAPVKAIQSVLDTYFEDWQFQPEEHENYASYQADNDLLIVKSKGFYPGNDSYELVSVSAVTNDCIEVQLKEGSSGRKLTIKGTVSGENVYFLRCKKEEVENTFTLQVEDPQLRQLFWAVLKNQADFFFVPTKETVTLLDLENHRKESMDEEDREFFRMFSDFTVFDLEQDGVPELIVQDSYCFKILRYDNDRLSCYNVSYRGMHNLRTDGTFRFSGGYRDNGIGRASFTETNMQTINIHWCQSHSLVNDACVEQYQCFVNGEVASQADLLQAFTHHEETEEVCWYAYNDETVDSLFGNAEEGTMKNH